MRTLLSRAFDFAHLGGSTASPEETANDLRAINGAAPPARAADKDNEDDERKRKDDESDDDYAKRMKKMDDDEAAAANKNKNKTKGEGDDCDDDEEEDRDDAKADASVRVAKAEARGARRMQRRIGKILSSPAAARNMKLAAKLACNTMMAADQAIVIVEETPAANSNRLEDRMSRAPTTRVPQGGATAPTPDAKIHAFWDTAFAPYSNAPK